MINNISANEVWSKLKENEHSCIVDVRCPSEIREFGSTDLSSIRKKVIFISWIDEISQTTNQHFIKNLEEHLTKDYTIFFLCAAGVRSYYAAELAIKNGFSNSHNILNGYNAAGGWVVSNLPCIQESMK